MTQAFLRASAAFLFMPVRDMQNRPLDGRIRRVYDEFMPEMPALGARAARNLASQLDALRGAIALKTQLELDKSCTLKF